MRALLLLAAAGCAAAGPAITLDPAGRFRAAGASSLEIYVAGAAEPVFGTSRRDGPDLVFEPRHPLRPGLEYRAVADGESRVFRLPAPPPGPSTELLRVFPTRDVLPENQLKFYLHFSAPMARGEAYRRVQLLQGGRRVELPFLEIGEELWDRSGTRLTLLFDPGRIKSGLKPREEEGPALEQGKSYVLAIEGGWLDAAGRPLRGEFRKAFRVAGPDTTPPDAKTWTWTIPRAGTKDPLQLVFPEPLDAGLLARVLVVEGVEGDILLDREETRWRHTPKSPWKAGAHALLVETILEDLAGNSLERAFEIDVVRPTESRPVAKTLSLPFTVVE